MDQDQGHSSPHATTIVTVRKGGKVVIAGDGQVSFGQSILKGNARKVRRIGKALAGATSSPALPGRRPTPSRCWKDWRPSSNNIPTS